MERKGHPALWKRFEEIAEAYYNPEKFPEDYGWDFERITMALDIFLEAEQRGIFDRADDDPEK